MGENKYSLDDALDKAMSEGSIYKDDPRLGTISEHEIGKSFLDREDRDWIDKGCLKERNRR